MAPERMRPNGQASGHGRGERLPCWPASLPFGVAGVIRGPGWATLGRVSMASVCVVFVFLQLYKRNKRKEKDQFTCVPPPPGQFHYS